MHETAEDLERLQRLLDRSYASAGGHLLSIHTPDRRMSAPEVAEVLSGVCVLNVATVTARCEPLVGPVDGLFYRGTWYFGSSQDSVRFRHIRSRPQVSATHTRGEELAVTVHGAASVVDTSATAHRGFRDYLLEVYGEDWETWGATAAYARIEPRRLFTFRLERQ